MKQKTYIGKITSSKLQYIIPSNLMFWDDVQKRSRTAWRQRQRVTNLKTSVLLVRDTTQTGRNSAIFWRNLLPPSSRLFY